MSLRTRLIAGLLLLAALGLLLLAGVTYAEQRHFLMKRVDDQVRVAASWSGARTGAGGPVGRYGPPIGLLLGGRPVEDGDDGGGRRPDERGPGGPPPGTWAIVRDGAGSDSATCFSCYSSTAAPRLPAGLSAAQP